MDAGRWRAAGDDARALTLAFTAGVLAVITQPALPPATLLVPLSIPALLPWRGRALWAMTMLGALLTCWQAQVLLDQRWPESRYGEEIWVQGRVASLPEQSASPGRDGEVASGTTWRFLFEPSDPALPPRIRASWYRSDQILKGGDCWRLQLRLKPPHGSLNPGGFDYEGWLFRQGIAATATVRAAQRCDGQDARVLRGGRDAGLQAAEGQDARVPRAGRDAGLRAAEGQDARVPRDSRDAALRATDDASGYALLKARQSLLDRLYGWLPESPGRGLLVALTLGDTSGLSDDDWQVFRVTGTTHLVAISGFNIAIVSGIAFFLFRWAWSLFPPLLLRLPAQKAAMLGAALFALVYALLAGWEPPVQRAFLMLAIITVAAWRGRLQQPSRTLALALLVVLLLDPLAVLSPGLWLSFGAVAAIFYVMTHRLRPRGWLASLVLLQLMLSLALAPLTVWFFHGLSWFSPLLNLLAVPLVSLLTPLLLAAIAAAQGLPVLGLPLLQRLADLLTLLREGLGWLAVHLPQPWLPAAAPAAALVLALIGALLLFAPRGLPLRVPALLCFLPLLFPPSTAPARGFELTALDVGQGLAVVVRTAGHTLVYDAGPAFDEGFDAGASIVAPYLLDAGVRRLDRLVISHADNDHAGGAAALRRLLSVDDELGALSVTPCRDGQRWDWDGVRFEMLHPDAAPWSRNNGGCVLRVEAGSYAALLPADIEKAAEQRLLRDQLTSLQADVLLAPHHGSRTSSTEDFIDAVMPQWVIHSAAWHSPFHHPHPGVVARYATAEARQIVTGLRGAITVHIDETGVSAPTSWREGHRHFWNAPAQDLEIAPLLATPAAPSPSPVGRGKKNR